MLRGFVDCGRGGWRVETRIPFGMTTKRRILFGDNGAEASRNADSLRGMTTKMDECGAFGGGLLGVVAGVRLVDGG